jgi:leucyl aminopeptidase
MDVRATTEAPAATGADTIAVGVFDDEGIAHDLPGGELTALLESGEARTGFRKLALTHAEGRRWLVAGLGKRDEFDPERAREAAAGVLGRARELGARSLCWELPHHLSDAHASAFAEGTVMGAYEFGEFKSGGDEDDGAELEELTVSAHHDISVPVEAGRVVAEAVNLARDLQNTPANHLTPTALAERARALAAELGTMINFEFDRADIRSADQGTLDRKAAVLAANPAVRLRIAGHADDRGSDEYNLALGNRRAAAAKRYLESKGVDGSRIEVVSYGEERPLNPGADEAAYAQNRRDEFEVTAGGDNLVAPQ